MFRSLYTAASGMMAQQMNLDNVANNLANSGTAGFRRRRLQFQDLLYQNLIMPGAAATQQTTVPSGLQVGLGTKTAASEVIQLQGDFNATGNPLDLAIEGSGFFQVTLPSGDIAYTRSGTFHLDAQGNLVTADGDPLEPSLTIPTGATSITVGSDGTVSVTLAGQTAAQQVGTIQTALFPNPGGLNSIGKNLFLVTTASGDPIVGTPGGTEGLGTIQQGMLEQSNVNVVEEFIQMILTQRAYEANSRVVSTADNMLQTLNNLGGKAVSSFRFLVSGFMRRKQSAASKEQSETSLGLVAHDSDTFFLAYRNFGGG
ncbi:MAG TPA: flagellar basal-body rod protein FlgG [Terriglobales bacterium]|jgi:flagellar basal-body rod protein FlgG|nr:flagellar basal-body rod protein FlgG [Terriglobales bacterium]